LEWGVRVFVCIFVGGDLEGEAPKKKIQKSSVMCVYFQLDLERAKVQDKQCHSISIYIDAQPTGLVLRILYLLHVYSLIYITQGLIH
jgi:hypothetical protein